MRIASSGGADADGVVGDLALTHVRNAHARKNCSGPLIAARCDDELNEVEVHSFTHSFVDARACDGRMRASNAAKVAFVSGNDGATFGEVNAIVFVVFAAACVCAQMRRVVVTHDDGVDVALGFVLAYAGLAAMFAPELARSVAGVAFAGCLATWPLARRWRDASTRPSHIETSVLREGVTAYRFVLTTLTITAILAIDFDLFPRRLGKTETYGLSLMDIGGGSYVFSSGFVSSLARFGEENRRGRKFQKRGGFLALVALGVARLAATAAVGYHTVESEYGRYWNFFFTLALVKLLAPAAPRDGVASTATAIAAMYQCVLLANGGALGAWILQDPSERVHPPVRNLAEWFLSVNREGIFSSIGYLCVYLGAASLGKMFLFSRKDGVGSFGKWLRDAVSMTGALWALTVFSHESIERASRRAGNAAYVAWTLAYNMQVIVAFTALRRLDARQTTVSCVVTSVSTNQLFVFLLSNVLTGGVNLAMDTMRASASTAWFIMGAYLAMVLGCARMRSA